MPADPLWLYICLAALFGLATGSFLNVCIYRLPRDLSVVAPRSFCPECKLPIAWYDNVPVLSYILLGRRCRRCGVRVSFRYPLVELSTAILFGALTARFGWTAVTLKYAVLTCLVTVLFWTDIDWRILPDELTLGGSAAGILFACLIPLSGPLTSLLLPGTPEPWRSLLEIACTALLLGGLLWLAAKPIAYWRKQEAVGLGDIKLILLLASFLGLDGTILALLIGSLTGAILGIAFIKFAGHDYRTYALPLGTFFCLGALASPFFHSRFP